MVDPGIPRSDAYSDFEQNHIIWQDFAQNSMKMKEFEPRRGRTSLDPQMFIFYICKKVKKLQFISARLVIAKN